jgi:hypothetical protein
MRQADRSADPPRSDRPPPSVDPSIPSTPPPPSHVRGRRVSRQPSFTPSSHVTRSLAQQGVFRMWLTDQTAPPCTELGHPARLAAPRLATTGAHRCAAGVLPFGITACSSCRNSMDVVGSSISLPTCRLRPLGPDKSGPKVHSVPRRAPRRGVFGGPEGRRVHHGGC